MLQQEQQKNKERILQLKKELQKQLKSTKLIDEQIHQQIEDKKLEFPFMLVSSNAKDIIRDYKEGKEISGVPLDIRKYGKKVFDYHIKKNIKPKKQKKITRTPLLCNHGISGSGKSVQQALNAHWFTDRFKNGVAIEITFNDDVEHLKLKSIKDTTQFESSLVRVIILRLIEFCCGTNYSIKLTEIMEKSRSWDFLPMLRALYPSGRLLERPLMFVRDVLGLPDDAPILLAVDELIKLKTDKQNSDMSEIIKYLNCICVEMDSSYKNDVKKNRDRTFWLSVSAYGCFSLTDYITHSNREINLQPLPPIFPITHNSESYDILPPILQCFKKENRKKIKITPKNMKLLKELSLLLMKSGGHPRRVETLLESLSLIEFKIDYLMFGKYDENYVDLKLVELKQNDLEAEMNRKFPFSADSIKTFAKDNLLLNNDTLYGFLSSKVAELKQDVTDQLIKTLIEEYYEKSKMHEQNEKRREKVFKNMLEPFGFLNLVGEHNIDTRKILNVGYASYVPGLSMGLLFIPYPVLEALTDLFPFCESMIDYFNCGEKKIVVKIWKLVFVMH